MIKRLEFLVQKCRVLEIRFAGVRQQRCKGNAFKPVAAGLFTLLGLLALGSLVMNKSARVAPNVPVPAVVETAPLPSTMSIGVSQSSPAVASTPLPTAVAIATPTPEPDPSEHPDAVAFADGWQFAEQLFWRGLLFSELNPKAWAKSHPASYGKITSDPRYATKFVEGAHAGEDGLVKETLGEPPLRGGDNGPVLSAQVSGPVGRAIKQGLNAPDSYRHDDARDYSRPRPCYYQNQWCWKVDKFWYRARNTFGGDVRDCVAAIVAKDGPYHEYKVLVLEEAKF